MNDKELSREEAVYAIDGLKDGSSGLRGKPPFADQLKATDATLRDDRDRWKARAEALEIFCRDVCWSVHEPVTEVTTANTRPKSELERLAQEVAKRWPWKGAQLTRDELVATQLIASQSEDFEELCAAIHALAAYFAKG